MKTFLLILLSIIILSCTTTKKVKMPSSLELTEAVTSREIEVMNSNTAHPVNPSVAFSSEDKEVVSYLKFKNLFVEKTIRWDWIDPANNLYYSTGNFILKPSGNNHKEEVSAWNSLTIKGTRATDFPGEWRVDAYLDNIVIYSTNFRIDTHIETLLPSARKPDPVKFGFIIGIEKYPDLPSAVYAENDARLVKEYFNKVIGVQEENIITLAGFEATRSKIMDYMKSYFPNKVKHDSILYVYYAGHGFSLPKEEVQEPYLVIYDSRLTTISETGYKLKDFYEDINNLDIKRAFIFFDTSFNGNAPITGNIISIGSSSGREISSAFPEKGHGLFTYFLLSGIRGEADRDKNNSISIGELYEYVRMNVSMVSRRKGMVQTPGITPSLNKIKDIEVTSNN